MKRIFISLFFFVSPHQVSSLTEGHNIHEWNTYNKHLHNRYNVSSHFRFIKVGMRCNVKIVNFMHAVFWIRKSGGSLPHGYHVDHMCYRVCTPHIRRIDRGLGEGERVKIRFWQAHISSWWTNTPRAEPSEIVTIDGVVCAFAATEAFVE